MIWIRQIPGRSKDIRANFPESLDRRTRLPADLPARLLGPGYVRLLALHILGIPTPHGAFAGQDVHWFYNEIIHLNNILQLSVRPHSSDHKRLSGGHLRQPRTLFPKLQRSRRVLGRFVVHRHLLGAQRTVQPTSERPGPAGARRRPSRLLRKDGVLGRARIRSRMTAGPGSSESHDGSYEPYVPPRFSPQSPCS